MARCLWDLICFLIVINVSIAVGIDDLLVEIPGGKFEMGSMNGESDEAPVRTVTLSPYSIHSKEVTEVQYGACVARGSCTPAHYEDGRCLAWNGKRFVKVVVPPSTRAPQLPVVCVTWHQARQYCRSQGMSLPTEAQWEYAARAGSIYRYPWGDMLQEGRCTLLRRDGPQKTGVTPPNGWGVYDMIGNVWEWTEDWYDPEAYLYESSTDPAGPQAGMYRVIRGGGWYSTAEQATVTNRQWFSPDFAEVSIGFRCVLP